MRFRGMLSGALVVATLVAIAAGRSVAEEKPIDWSGHMGGLAFVVGPEPGMEEAKFTGRPPMYFFTSSTNKWCPKFARRTWTNKTVRKCIASYTPILVDFDKHKELADKLVAPIVPAVIWTEFDGETILFMVGDAPIEMFIENAKIAEDRAPEVKLTKEYLELLELGKQLDVLAKRSDPRATFAVIAKIRAVRLGREVQIRAEAADAKITKDAREGIDAAKAFLERKKRIDAIKTLKKVVKAFDWHPIGAEAAALLEEIRSKKKR